jgi:hypothetical protein
MAIDLVPLCTIRLQARPPIEVGAGQLEHEWSSRLQASKSKAIG